MSLPAGWIALAAVLALLLGSWLTLVGRGIWMSILCYSESKASLATVRGPYRLG